jgi:hypothetical protein
MSWKRPGTNSKAKPAKGVHYIETPNVGWTCPWCKAGNTAYFDPSDQQGGCRGHGPGQYCYCDSRHWLEHRACSACGKPTEIHLNA